MSTAGVARARPPLWRDVRVLRVLLQLVFLAAVVALLAYLWWILSDNMRDRGLPTGYDYIDQPAGFAIPNSDFSSGSSFATALRYGVKNTAIVAGTGVLLSTLIGVAVGIARLSSNWLLRKAAAAYVETLRNIPVLLIIFLWYFGVILKLPRVERAYEWLDAIVLSNRGLAVPSLTAPRGAGTFLAALTVAGLLGLVVARWRTRRSERSGEPHHRVLWGLAASVVVSVAAYAALGGPVALSLPELTDRHVTGGIEMNPEFAALLIALVLYTASHIAEVTRGSILAVPAGQSEAASALGLSDGQRVRFVVLPQALRIMVPPLANQYLNLTKNSSLAVAIGYYEITKITQVTISQSGPAPQAIALLMLLYLGFSLTIAGLANLANRRLLRARMT